MESPEQAASAPMTQAYATLSKRPVFNIIYIMRSLRHGNGITVPQAAGLQAVWVTLKDWKSVF